MWHRFSIKHHRFVNVFQSEFGAEIELSYLGWVWWESEKIYNKQLKADGLVFCDIHLRSRILICAVIGFKILK